MLQQQRILLSICVVIFTILLYQYLCRPEGTEPLAIGRQLAAPNTNCFRAAVYEHSSLGDDTPDDNDSPANILQMNLAHYLDAISAASKDDAKLIVLPEDSLINSEKYSRKILIEQILEPMPEPDEELIVLCSSSKWKPGSILKNISCAAIEHRIWIALSFGDKVRCKSADTNCPEDGHYLYNSIGLFNSAGQMVAKYHKIQLYHEHQYNLPSDCMFHPNPIVYHDSPFGRLGFAVCFDAIYQNPLQDLVYKYQIDTLIYSTYWFNYWPFNVAVQVQQSLAIAYNINFLASNVHNPQHSTFGSGIYAGFYGENVHTNVGDGVSRILIADVARKPNTGFKCNPRPNVIKLWSRYVKPAQEWNFDPKMFTFKKLTFKQDMIDHCIPNTTTCCSLFYRVRNAQQLMNDNFHMIIGSTMGPGLNASPYRIYQEFCAIVSCKNSDCREYSRTSSTLFTAVNLKAKFQSRLVFPSVMIDGARLLTKREWSFYPKQSMSIIPDWSMITMSLVDKPILLVTLYGRPFENDVPYKHKP